MTIESIRQRKDAATRGPDYNGYFIAVPRTDVELLLAVAEAARLVKAQCDDLCPSWQDEPCDCGMAALRAALAALEAGA